MEHNQTRSSPNPHSIGGTVHDQQDGGQVRVEDMPLDKKLEVLKKYNPYEYFDEGRFIDAQDSVNQWCLGQIVGVDNRSLNVHFDGWSSRWDTWVKITSYKIASFRRNSRGYTGQNKIALRTIKFNLDDLHQEKQRVERLIESDLNGLGAFETTQYFRGRLYIFVDFLLQGGPYTEEQIDAINDFLYCVLRLIVTWLKKLPKIMHLYSQVKVNSDLFLIDENIAILLCSYEFMDILKKYFCCCNRCIRYYLLHDKNPIEFVNPVTQKFDHINFEAQRKKDDEDIEPDEVRDMIYSRRNLVFGQFLNFINYFAEIGGFDAIVDFLKQGSEAEEKIPLELISLMANPFRNCNSIFAPTFSDRFVQSIKQILVNRLQTLSEKEIKEIDKESIGRVLNELKDFLTLSLSDLETAELIESNQLQTSLRFLKSTYLEKRLKGISDIKTFLDRIEFAEKQAKFKQMQNDKFMKGSLDQDMGGMRMLKLLKWLNADIMKNWILSNKVLDIVLGENTHLEIVKRSSCLLKFLAKQQSLPQETIDLIWKCQLGKHEEMVRVVYSIIQELVPFIHTNYIDLLYHKISQVPPQSYDKLFLDFLKDFTNKSLENYFDQKSSESNMSESNALPYDEMIQKREVQTIQRFSDFIQNNAMQDQEHEDKQYGLPIFWDLIQDKSQVPAEILQIGITSITDILKQTYSQPIRMHYLIKAVEKLQKGDSIVQSIIIIQSIISEYPTFEYNEQNISQKTIITQLERQVQLVNMVIQNIVNYNLQVKDKVKQFIEKKKSLPDDVSNTIFVGKHSHETTINHLLGFLEYLIINSSQQVAIGTANIDTLWQIFVQQPNFNQDQNLFLKWINQHREHGYDRREYFLFTDEERKYFFTKILCNPTYVDFQRISLGQVKCFHKYFKVINQQEEHIEITKKRMRVVQYEKLIGLDTLWRIALECENERSREESMDLLVDIHLKFDSSIAIKEQELIWNNFIQRCMANLDQQNDFIVSNTIQLLSKFLDRYEGKKHLKPEIKTQNFQNLQPLNIQVFRREDQQRKQIHVSYFQTLGFIRQKIAEAFDMQINEFTMHIKNSYVDPDEDDDKYVKDVGLIQSIIVQKNNLYNPDNHPKFLISSDLNNYDKLFTLLSKENPSLVEPAWSLLQKLPINQKLQQELKELQGLNDANKNWEKILDPHSTNKLLYSLNIINSLHANKKDPRAQQWRYKFVQMGGFVHLLKTFVNLDIKQIDSNLTTKCIDLLIIILYEFINSDKDLNKQVLDIKEQIILKCINLIDLVSDYTIKSEQKRGDSYEDIQKRIQQNKQKKNKYRSYNKSQNQGENKNEDEEDQESSEYTTMQQILKQFQDDVATVQNLFRFMTVTVLQKDYSNVTIIDKYPNLENMLLKTTIMTENWSIRDQVMKKFREFIITRAQTQDMNIMIDIVNIFVFKLQEVTEKYEGRCFHFYEGLTLIIESLQLNDLEPLRPQFQNLIIEMSKFIFNREIKEKNTQDQDQLLNGKMKLLKALLQKFSNMKEPAGALLTEHLLHNCLFEIPQGGQTQIKNGPPKCKNSNSRTQAIRLLAVLCRDNLSNLNMVLNYMQKFNQNPSWRTNKDHDWNISLMDSEKSSTGYVGIKNPSSICYMNSLFQQLFMLSSLRNDLLSTKDPNQDKVEKEESMLYQLQLLFAGLLKSEKQYVNPKGFCHAFKDWEGNPTNMFEQMDVEEFFNMLMDRIETAIKGTPHQNTIQYHFGGKFANEMICQGCPHKYERQEPFLSISISVKNKKSILEGLNAFIQGDMLEGDNAYYCEKCDKKLDTLKRTCVKKLPRYQIIALKRFEFDYDKMIRVKVNDYCEFPMEFSMEPYTQEGLARREKMAKIKEEKGDEFDEAEFEKQNPLKYPPQYYEYQLSGIVVHSGTADSGHYYSFIKDREHPESGKWYEFNDHIVRDFDPNDIPQECFGGEDTFQGYNMVQMKSMKWRNAYLLFYERKTPIDVQSDEDTEKEKTSSLNKEDVDMNSNSPQQLSILDEIEEKIAYENQKYWQNRFLFGNEYHEFVYDLSLNWNTSNIIPKNYLTKNNDFHITGFPMPKDYDKDNSIPEPLDVKIPLDQTQVSLYEESVFKLAAGFYITILQRAANKQYIPQMSNLLKAYINKNRNCASWLISEFCNYKLIEENFLQCGQKEMRKFTAGLIYCALLKVYESEKALLSDYWNDPMDPERNKTVIGNFALVLIENVFQLKRFVANMPQYLQLIARLSSLGSEMREFLLRAKTVGRLMEFFFDEVSPHKEFFRDMSDINPKYKEKPEIGLPTEINKKQMSQFQEILERRRMKNLAEAPPRYKYLVEAVSNCIRGFSNGEKRSPYQLDDIQFEALHPNERDLFIPDSKFLKRVFAESKKNRSVVAVCSGYVHFAWNEKEAFKELLGVIQQGLNENDYEDLKPYLMLLQFIFQNPGGDIPEQRFQMAIQIFFETIKANQQYYKFMETIYEFIFKVVAKIPRVREWFRTKRQSWQFLIDWCESVRFPMNQSDPNNTVRLYKRRGNLQIHQQQLKNEYYRFQIMKEVRQKRLDMLKSDQALDLSQEPDMDMIDLQDYKFTYGENFEIYNKKQERVSYAQVEQVLDEMIQYKIMYNQNNDQSNQQQYQNQNNLIWIACDTDKLMPIGTFKNLYKVRYYSSNNVQTKIYEYYQGVVDKQRRDQMNSQGSGGNSMMRQGGGNPNEMEYEMGDGNNAGGNQYGGSDDDDNDNDSNDIYD